MKPKMARRDFVSAIGPAMVGYLAYPHEFLAEISEKKAKRIGFCGVRLFRLFAQTRSEYGKSIGIKVPIENHGGYSSNPDNIRSILGYVNSPWWGTLPDFANMPRTYISKTGGLDL